MGCFYKLETVLCTAGLRSICEFVEVVANQYSSEDAILILLRNYYRRRCSLGDEVHPDHLAMDKGELHALLARLLGPHEALAH